MRTERDFLGELDLNDDDLFGIHSRRAQQNFPDTTVFHKEWYAATGKVKQAVFVTYKKFRKALLEKEPDFNSFPLIDETTLELLENVSKEVAEGKYYDHFIVPAISGGAGTSINMNVNEIIANVALQEMGKKPGQYDLVDPIEDVNIFQSTNDVIPTALKVAGMELLNTLECAINSLRQDLEKLESGYRHHLRSAYTEMQEAVPSSYGMLFSAYNEALSRDWWRVSKCFERVKQVNLGGSAAGTAITVPRFMVMEMVSSLRDITGLPLSRSENMPDSTANQDAWVEVHAILKAHAVNLEKMVSDLRLLASDLTRKPELRIPQKQLGSSIMPDKVNPVIPEFVISVAHQVYANDQVVSSLSALGTLDLNAYLPLIGHRVLESMKLLIAADKSIREHLVDGIEIDGKGASENLLKSPAVVTAFVPYVGYHKAAELARFMKKNRCDVLEANEKLNIMDKDKMSELLKPRNLLKEGFSINDLK